MRLVDSHCHLQSERLAADAEALTAAARAAGVERILVPGWNGWSSAAALELAEAIPWLDAAVGVHPHDAAKVADDEWRTIAALADDARVVAIGETGLDFDRGFSPVDAQLANLRRNLVLALATGKPAILHVRSKPGRSDAQDALVAELRTAGVGEGAWSVTFAGRPPAVIHSFSGSVPFARAVLDLGLAISISGLLFRAGEESTADVARLAPADRLLVETDAPFLAPPGAPRRNEPAWVGVTATRVAEARGDQPDAFGAALVGTYERTFPRGR